MAEILLNKIPINQKEILTQAEWEVQKLNQFSRTLNQITDLDFILFQMINFIQEEFSFKFTWVLLRDREKNHFYTKGIYGPENTYSVETHIFFEEFPIPIKKESGSLYKCFRGKKPIYYKKIPKNFTGNKFDSIIISKLNAVDLFQIPLLVHNRTLGMLCFFNREENLEITNVELKKISRFCNQVAGAIHSANLIQEASKAKKNADEQKKIAEKSKLEVEELINLLRRINETNKLSEILGYIHKFIFDQYDLNYYTFYLKNKEGTALQLSGFKLPEFISKEDKTRIETTIFPLESHRSLLINAFFKKRNINLPKLRSSFISKFSEFDKFIADVCQVKSLFMVPMVIGDKPIGIITFPTIKGEDKVINKETRKKISILIEQVAGTINSKNLLQLIKEKQKLEEKAKKEVQKLNDFSKKIINASNIEQLMDLIFTHIRSEIEFEIGLLALKNEEHESLAYYKPDHSPFLNANEKAFFSKSNISIKNKHDIISESIYDKIPLYLPRIDENTNSNYIENLSKEISIKSLLMVPLIISGKVIGVIMIFRKNDAIEISNEQIQNLSVAIDQVSGVLNNFLLFEEMKLEQQKAIEAQTNAEIAQEAAEIERSKADSLLNKILPKIIATELMEKGEVEPKFYDKVTIIFTDFKGFTQSVAKMNPIELVKKLDATFGQFDRICTRHNLEKIKTIGDAYMCAGGLPQENKTHHIDACLAALEMNYFMSEIMKLRTEITDDDFWEIRIGVHTGDVMAGVVGTNKFVYDMWGDTVNIASRMESNGDAGKINISEETYKLVNNYFECTYRGKITAKGKGKVDMYYLLRLKEIYSRDTEGIIYNDFFKKEYDGLHLVKDLNQPEIKMSKKMKIVQQTHDGITRLYISGILDFHNAAELRKRFEELERDNKTNIIINLKNIKFIDSTGLGGLIYAHHKFDESWGNLFFCNVSNEMDRIFQLSGLRDFFKIFSTEQEAELEFKKLYAST